MNCEQCDKPVSQNWGLKLCPECARSETSPPKPSEPIELEDIIDKYMASNDEQDALAKSLMKDDLLEWVKSLPKKEGK